MIQSVARHEGGTVLDALYHQLLQTGVQYFLPSSRLEIVGSASPSASELGHPHARLYNPTLDSVTALHRFDLLLKITH